MTLRSMEYLDQVKHNPGLPEYSNNNFPVPAKKRTLAMKDLKSTGVNKDSMYEYIE